MKMDMTSITLIALVSLQCALYSAARQTKMHFQYGAKGFFDDISAFQEPQSAGYSGFSQYRSGQASETHDCNTITGVPKELTFITRYNFYAKYTHAYNIPVISSAKVSDKALKRACYILRFLFADRKDIRDMMYKHYGRVGVIAISEQTTTIPEHSHLADWWNQRARGLGAMIGTPISTGGEENLLCLSQDRYRGDDIFFHEASHAVAEVSLRGGAIPGWYDRLEKQYRYALSQGLWRNTYSAETVREYFAEGAQSFFNCHVERIPTDNIHGAINTRKELESYDPGLYKLLQEVFPCMNDYEMCPTGTPKEPRMNCGGNTGPTQTPSGCQDNNSNCAHWASAGYCTNPSHKDYMTTSCRKACRLCFF